MISSASAPRASAADAGSGSQTSSQISSPEAQAVEIHHRRLRVPGVK